MTKRIAGVDTDLSRISRRFIVAVLVAALLCLGCALASQREHVSSRAVLPGDLLQIRCEETGELCVSAIVNDDGKILLPWLGGVGVATLTSQQIQDKIIDLLKEQGFSTPHVRVSSQFLKGAPISIDGAVNHPVRLRFLRGVSLSDLLQSAMPTSVADLYVIRISHADGTEDTVKSLDTMKLFDGDRVTVPISTKSHSVQIVGGVNKPCQIDFEPGQTLGDALAAAGGISLRGIGSQIVIERNGEAIPVALPDDAQRSILIGDRIRVEVSLDIGHVVVLGAVAHPGLVDLAKGLTLTQAIRATGGILPGPAGSDTVWVHQHLSNKRGRAVRMSFRLILAGRLPDPVLSLNDVVQVGSRDLESKR